MSSNTPTPRSRSNERINGNIPEHQTNAPIANDSEVRERINSALRATVSGDAYEVVHKLGLPPFPEFEEALAPFLERVKPRKARALVEKLYVVAAKYVVKQGRRLGIEAEPRQIRKRRMQLQWTRVNIRRARNALSAAEARFPKRLPTFFDFPGTIRQLSEFEMDLVKREQQLAAIIHPKRKNPAEKALPAPKPSGRPLLSTSAKTLEQRFIRELNKSLPKPSKGKRARFARYKVIQGVLRTLGVTTSLRRIMRDGKSRTAPRKGDKKK